MFDFDDTLVVSRTDRGNVLLEALQSFGVATRPERIDDLWGRPFRELVSGVAPGIDDRYEEFLEYYSHALRSRPPIACPGVIESVRSLRPRHRLFVHSASHSLLVRSDLQSLGILQYFEFVCGSDWQLAPKPDPLSLATLSVVIEAQGVSLRGGWYVGDSPSDRRIAEAWGLTFVGFGLEGSSAAYTIRSMIELGRIVDQER